MENEQKDSTSNMQDDECDAPICCICGNPVDKSDVKPGSTVCYYCWRDYKNDQNDFE